VAPMVTEVPEELEALGDAMMEASAAVRKARAGTGAGKALDYAAVEVDIGDAAARIERAGHQAVLQTLDVDRPSVLIGGARYTKVGRCEATCFTLAGPVVVKRSLHCEAGKRNAKVVDPGSLRAGVVEDHSLPRTASAMAHQVQYVASREAEESARHLGRLPYSQSSFERVAHALGSLYVPAYGDVEDALVEEYEIPCGLADVTPTVGRRGCRGGRSWESGAIGSPHHRAPGAARSETAGFCRREFRLVRVCPRAR